MSERTIDRLRLAFSVGDEVKYISHLDLLRAWERILRRAGLPLAYSQGFNPHPRIVIAMPLPVGCTGANEMVDVYLDEVLDPAAVVSALAPALPVGIGVSSAIRVSTGEEALPNQISGAWYRLSLADASLDHVSRQADELLAMERYEVTFRRKTLDLRPLIGALSVCAEGGCTVIEALLLRNASGRIGRPDVLLEALGLTAYVRGVHRAQIVFGEAG